MAVITVRDLKEVLAQCPDDLLIVLARDSEGNGYSPMYSYYIGSYVAETEWSGDLLDEDKETKETKNALVLWPSN